MISNTNKLNEDKKKKIVLICQYIISKHILNWNLVKVCARTIGHIDVEKIKNTIFSDFDKDLLDNKRLHLSKIMPLILTTYVKEKYYYNLGELYFFIKYVLDIDISSIKNILNVFISIKAFCLWIYNKRFEILNKLLRLESYHCLLAVGIDMNRWAVACFKEDLINKLIELGHTLYYRYRPVELVVDIIRVIYGFFVKKDNNEITLFKIIGFIDLLLYIILIFNTKTFVINY